MNFFTELRDNIRKVADIRGYMDTDAAAEAIRKNIHFRGPNVWILGFSIVIASVGLNVNSTAVIIGAMLISPLMGPIIGMGLGLGVNDTHLIRDAIKNLVVMLIISLLASFLYFLLTPLKLANPTELLARTNPTIYDVLIALFGGLAGIFELSRKEKGTVLSGVAIATALMPPICTAGYGLATMNFNHFAGAFFLFCINCVFIVLATYLAVKYLQFKEVEFTNEENARKTRRLISAVIIIVMVPSIWSAVVMIRDNKFTQNVEQFVSQNKMLSNGYIYDYKIDLKKGGSVTVYITGGELTATEKNGLIEAAENLGIQRNQLTFSEHGIGKDENDASEKLIKGIYERTDSEISKKEAQIRFLEEQLSRLRKDEIPYVQLTKEVITQYPDVQNLYVSRGAEVSSDSLRANPAMLIVVTSKEELSTERTEKLTEWLKVRLNDSTVVVMNQRPQQNPKAVTE